MVDSKKVLVFMSIFLLFGVYFSTGIIAYNSKPNIEKIILIKSDDSSRHISTEGKNIRKSNTYIQQILSDNTAFAFEGDQLHPAFGSTENGIHLAAYWDSNFDTIFWTFSTDGGVTYAPGFFYGYWADHPSIKLWEGTCFFGTHVTDSNEFNGGATHLIGCTDPTNYDTYFNIYWDWSSYGWHDMIDADIACDSSQNPWEWGFSTYVMSTTYNGGYTDGPTITYMDPDDEESALISWYPGYNRCTHTMADIDHITHKTYAIYDWNDTGIWKLLIRQDDFSDWNWSGAAMYELEDDGNLQCPVVAAYDDNLVILAETDENDNKDIVCYYSSNGINDGILEKSFVVDSGDDESYPEITHVADSNFVCTFMANGNIFYTVTYDGGATWSEPEQINDNDGTVVEEYKSSDLCEKAAKVLWEDNRNEDIDIYIGDGPVSIIELEFDSECFGASAVIRNKGDIDSGPVDWNIDIKGGLLFSDRHFEDTIQNIPAGGQTTVETGLMLGFGRIMITVTADETTDTRKDFLFFIINIPLK